MRLRRTLIIVALLASSCGAPEPTAPTRTQQTQYTSGRRSSSNGTSVGYLPPVINGQYPPAVNPSETPPTTGIDPSLGTNPGTLPAGTVSTGTIPTTPTTVDPNLQTPVVTQTETFTAYVVVGTNQGDMLIEQKVVNTIDECRSVISDPSPYCSRLGIPQGIPVYVDCRSNLTQQLHHKDNTGVPCGASSTTTTTSTPITSSPTTTVVQQPVAQPPPTTTTTNTASGTTKIILFTPSSPGGTTAASYTESVAQCHARFASVPAGLCSQYSGQKPTTVKVQCSDGQSKAARC